MNLGQDNQKPLINAIDNSNKDIQNVSIDANDQDNTFVELTKLKHQILESKCPDLLKERMKNMLQRLLRMAKRGTYSDDYEYISKYIDWVNQMPWGQHTKETLDLDLTKKLLNEEHYGLDKVKDRVLEHIATKVLLNKKSDQPEYAEALRKSPILCFVGLQGVGKTTTAGKLSVFIKKKFKKTVQPSTTIWTNYRKI